MFQLPDTTACKCTNANPRVEFHGDEQHRAIDLTFEVKGENTLLDAIAPGLRAHHYCNRALDAKQAPLPEVVVPLPNLRFTQLPTSVRWDQPKARGYRWTWEWGREAQHVDFSDAALGGIAYTMHEGGSVEVKFTVSYNGDELANNALYGELSGLPAMGDVHIQLFAPPELMPVKKGWRSGVAESTSTDGGGELFDGEGHPGEGVEEQDEHPEGSPEAALAATEPQEYPAPPPARRGRKAAAAATTH